MSLSELETLHQLCELERTQILQSLALAVLKIPCAGYLLSGNRSNFLDYEGNILWFYTCTKKVSPLYVFEDKRCYKRIPIFYKNKVHFVDTLSRRTYFRDTAVPCGSENSHNVVQLNPDEDKYCLLTPYLTLMQSLKKFSPESIRAIARYPNIDLQSIGIYSETDIQHHNRTQQFQELLTQMDPIQRQSIDQNLRKLAETAGFADIYTQDYSGYFKRYQRLHIFKRWKIQTTRYFTYKYLQFCHLKKRNSTFSRMALLHVRKINYLIRHV